MIVLVIIGTKGTMTTASKKKLEAIQVKKLVDSLQKAAKLGTSHITRKAFITAETGSMSGGYLHWFKRRSTGEKRPVIREVMIIITTTIIIRF